VAAIIGKKYQQLITSCLLVRHKVKSLSNRPVEERLVLFLNRGKIIILQQKKVKEISAKEMVWIPRFSQSQQKVKIEKKLRWD